VNQSVVYNKANSIIELKGNDKNKLLIVSELQKLYENLKVQDSDKVVIKALEDLFDEQKTQSVSDAFFLREHVIEEMARLDVCDYHRYLKYRYAYEMYPHMHYVSEYPPLVQIEPTSICNYRCVFCYQADQRLSDKKNGHMGSMSIEIFKKVIDQIEGHVEGVTLASRGEPTVNKRLPEMLSYMSGKFLASKLNTNAYLLDEKMIHSILEADLQTLVFSADSASEPLYSKLRVNGDLNRVVRNVELFHNIKETQYPDSRMITRVSGVNFSDQQNISDMQIFWKKYVEQVVFVDYNPWENVYDSHRKKIDQACSDLWRRMFVWWDGKIAPCDVDYLTTLSSDTINDESISKVWNGGNYTQLRKRHLMGERNKIEPCARCVVV
jgi:wyosine [tRNA(Phe)-imidazoG37] synthetase (radical SAM superfamily)